MDIPIFQVDAFSEKVFGGNPAAVCPLEHWLPPGVMQSVALENNLSETAFFVRQGDIFEIRWFTPALEIDLCGHATLASGHVIFEHLNYGKDEIDFFSPKSGALRTIRRDGLLYLDFPAHEARPIDPPRALVQGLGAAPRETYKGRDFLAVFDREADIAGLQPDMAELAALDCIGICATARGDSSDFVSRFFAPRAGVPEDPVTGSAHTLLIPFWAKRLNKTRLHAFQISRRRGELFCEHLGPRVLIGGRAVTFLTGTIRI